MIHKGFDFKQLGGFPTNQQRLEYMQEAYTGIADALVGLVGGNAIVSGCVVAGNNVSAGWVVIGGELLPFLGSSTGVQTTVLVRETKTALTFLDNSNKEVQFSRSVQFGTGTGAIAWSSLVRVPSLIGINNSLKSINTSLTTDAQNLTNHINNKANPHTVTKSQVGLSNIPNAKTDDPKVSDSNILATSKAVSLVNGVANGLTSKVITGQIYVSWAASFSTITVDTDLPIEGMNPADYIGFFTEPSSKRGFSQINAVYDSSTPNKITFRLYKDSNTGAIYTTFDYVLIRKS